jgi:hypothetical protein
MMRKLTQLLALCVLALPLVAQARGNVEHPNYWAVAWSSGEYDQDTDPNVKVDQNGLQLKVGRFLGRYFAVEGHFGTYGKKDTAVPGYANSVGLQIEGMASVFARGNAPFAQGQANLYVLLGATYASAHSDDGNIIVFDEGVAAPAFGFGASFFGDDRNGIELEYIRYMQQGEVDDIKFDVTMWNLGYVRRF